jgi:hypothetical protein
MNNKRKRKKKKKKTKLIASVSKHTASTFLTLDINPEPRKTSVGKNKQEVPQKSPHIPWTPQVFAVGEACNPPCP